MNLHIIKIRLTSQFDREKTRFFEQNNADSIEIKKKVQKFEGFNHMNNRHKTSYIEKNKKSKKESKKEKKF